MPVWIEDSERLSLPGDIRRRAVATGVIVILLACVNCGRPTVPPLSHLAMTDERSEKQLIAGFWGLEEKSWRWTSRRFAVVLWPPPGSEQSGATLRLQLYVPPQQIEKLGPLTLRADVGDFSLPPEVLAAGGELTYSGNIPPSLIGRMMLPVVFVLDKAFDNTKIDGRHLGIIVTSVSLDSKSH
jgi:hypothetical protein